MIESPLRERLINDPSKRTQQSKLLPEGLPSDAGITYSEFVAVHDRYTDPIDRRRACWLISSWGVAGLCLLGRLLQIQIVEGSRWCHRAVNQRLDYLELRARPGDILDRRGRVLVTSQLCQSLYVSPCKMTHLWQAATELAAALGLDRDELFMKLGAYAQRQFVWIKRHLTDQEAARVEQLKWPPEIWGFQQEFRRVYPLGTCAVQVLGYRSIDGEGLAGVEKSGDERLRGTPGKQRVIRDALGRNVYVFAHADPPVKHGEPLELTLEASMQEVVEQQLERLHKTWHPVSSCGIVMSAQTAEILAMASHPKPGENFPRKNDAPSWVNRAIAWQYEPGSTLKPCIVAYGLQLGVIHTKESIDCEWGLYRMGRRLLHDHRSFGRLSLHDVLVLSSNIGMAKIGERLGRERLYAALRAFHLGMPTGIELPGELPGLIRPIEEWTEYSLGSIPIGQELAVTPLQLLAAYSCLVTAGEYRKPTLFKSLTTTVKPSSENRVINPEIARWLRTGPLLDVIRRGTGRLAFRRELPMFGKTGTSQIAIPGQGYSEDLVVCSFIGGTPVDDPQLICLVVAERPQGAQATGGRVAAPIAAEILYQCMKIWES